ncbi:NUDIX hydrolase [Vandammella animalimorsus]|uniref:NUDIX hydrolase n=1 Tax=Vandammella animalimorsus TaxID=2029117 RepID=A0A2A2A970_9BURK|nr:NUDIX hydrolase [Vandammella animalimorsus]PAT35065.1 NUDIX hydrolase [Vandammella animalimorsus]
MSEHAAAPLPEDTPAAILPAASMIVLRPGPGGGFEVLLTERAAGVRNFAGALVFPGGKVEPGDEAIAEHSGFAAHWPNLAPRLPDDDRDATHIARLYGAALRETLEEVGLLHTPAAQPASAQAVASARQALAQGMAWCEALAQHGLQACVRDLQPFSRWITPTTPNMSLKRFDTWFFIAELMPGQRPEADGHEAQSLHWATPGDFLQRHQQREILLAPPQIMTLAHLGRFASAAELLAYARAQTPYCIAPVSVDDAGQRMICLPGDPLHPQPQRQMPGTTRLVLRGRHFEPLSEFDAA